MNKNVAKIAAFPLTFAASSLIFGGFSAIAQALEVPETDVVPAIEEVQPVASELPTTLDGGIVAPAPAVSTDTITETAEPTTVADFSAPLLEDSSLLETVEPSNATDLAVNPPAPIPGSVSTDATTLTAPEFAEIDPNAIAQDIEVGTTTRGGSSYIGAGGNIGFGGDSALGDFGFTIFGKVGFSRNFSVRPAFIFGDNVALTVPLTYDFVVSREPFEAVAIAPFIGGGAAFDFDGGVGPLITGGVDFPLSPQLTATAMLNVAFLTDSDTTAGIILGVGYNFSGLIER